MSNYKIPGWKMKSSELKEFTAITSENRKAAVILGRILYVITASGTLVEYQGYFTVRPRLQVGRIKVTGHPFEIDQNTYIPEEESMESYRKSFDELITHCIRENKLFFKITDKLVNYEKIKV